MMIWRIIDALNEGARMEPGNFPLALLISDAESRIILSCSLHNTEKYAAYFCWDSLERRSENKITENLWRLAFGNLKGLLRWQKRILLENKQTKERGTHR